MAGTLRGCSFSRFLFVVSEWHRNEEERDPLLRKYETEQGIPPRPSRFIVPEISSSNTAQPSVRYVSFGIGGAGNIRRWV